MNPKNIIAVVELFNKKDTEPVTSYYLTKTGTLYQAHQGELTLKKDTYKTIGVTGKELLKAYSEDIFQYSTNKGVIIINEDTISDMLILQNIY